MRKQLLCALTLACAASLQAAVALKTSKLGKMQDGRDIHSFALSNDHGMKIQVIEYGAILASVQVRDAKGKVAEVTLGFDSAEGWLSNTNYFGSTVGRFGNRIAHGKFTLEGKEYTLATNNNPGGIPCHLHGGKVGFDKVLWSGTPVEIGEAKGVKLTYVSPNGEEGYPGTLTVHVTYLLNDKNEVSWDVEATTDATTIVNVAQHTYWNLSGDPLRSINDHVLSIPADHYLPTDAGLIPTGEIAPVEGTPMDFRKPIAIGKRVDEKFEALKFAGGYDHAWVLNTEKGVRLSATVTDPHSGRTLKVYADKPAIQFYGGNFLDGTVAGKGGAKYPFRSGLCLETEGFPDSPNRANFPSVTLKPGETYHHKMVFAFSN